MGEMKGSTSNGLWLRGRAPLAFRPLIVISFLLVGLGSSLAGIPASGFYARRMDLGLPLKITASDQARYASDEALETRGTWTAVGLNCPAEFSVIDLPEQACKKMPRRSQPAVAQRPLRILLGPHFRKLECDGIAGLELLSMCWQRDTRRKPAFHSHKTIVAAKYGFC